MLGSQVPTPKEREGPTTSGDTAWKQQFKKGLGRREGDYLLIEELALRAKNHQETAPGTKELVDVICLSHSFRPPT